MFITLPQKPTPVLQHYAIKINTTQAMRGNTDASGNTIITTVETREYWARAFNAADYEDFVEDAICLVVSDSEQNAIFKYIELTDGKTLVY